MVWPVIGATAAGAGASSVMSAAIPALIGAGGSILGGLLGSSGQSSANRANIRIARENREWQGMMSSTANQRAAADLQKAGLNRILAFGKPASTPAGNIATMQNEKKQLGESISGGVQSAVMLNQQLKNMKAQEQLTLAQASAIKPAAAIGGGVGTMLEAVPKGITTIVEEVLKLIHGGAPGQTPPAIIKEGATTARQERTHEQEKATLRVVIRQLEDQLKLYKNEDVDSRRIKQKLRIARNKLTLMGN